MAKSSYYGSERTDCVNSPHQPLYLSSHTQHYVSCIKMKMDSLNLIRSQGTRRGNIEILNKKEAVMKIGDKYFPLTIAEEDPTSLALGKSLHHLYVRHGTKLQKSGNIYHTMQLDDKDRIHEWMAEANILDRPLLEFKTKRKREVYSRPDTSKKTTFPNQNSVNIGQKKINGNNKTSSKPKNVKIKTSPKGNKEKKKKARKKKTQYLLKDQKKNISIILIHLLAMEENLKMGKIKQRFELHMKTKGAQVEDEFRIIHKHNLLEESVKRVADVSINGTCTLKEEHKKRYVTRQLIHESTFLIPMEKRTLFNIIGEQKKKRDSLEKIEEKTTEIQQKRKLENTIETARKKTKFEHNYKAKPQYTDVNNSQTYKAYKKIFEDKRQEYLALQQKLKLNAKEFDNLNKKRKQDKNISSTERDNLANEIHHKFLQRKGSISKDKSKAKALFDELDILKKKIVAWLQKIHGNSIHISSRSHR